MANMPDGFQHYTAAALAAMPDDARFEDRQGRICTPNTWPGEWVVWDDADCTAGMVLKTWQLAKRLLRRIA